jgi:hypothetical protein
MTWKSYALASGAGLLATYLASYSTTLVTEPARQGAPIDAARSTPGPDIVEEANRLQARMRAVAVYREPARNPFRFGARQVAPPPAAAVPPAVATALPAPAPPRELPFVVLAGIATDMVSGAPERTAILTTTAGVVLVRAGEMVGADYRVREVGEDAVVLESPGDGSIRTLRLSTADSRLPTANPF